VGVYDELVKSVRQLTERNSKFMKNEIEICKLINLTSISKKELEQKEKKSQELKERINASEHGEKIMYNVDKNIRVKQEKIEKMSRDLHEKDKVIE
jgi:hypothetical protein